MVTVWIGNVPSEAVFDAYLGETYGSDDTPMSAFCGDLGESLYDHDVQDVSWRASPTEVAKLLAPYSKGTLFAKEAATAAAAQGIVKANAVILLYDLEHLAAWPKGAPFCRIGTFSAPWRDDSPAGPARRPGDGHVGRVTSLAVGGGGLAVSASFNGEVTRWNLHEGTQNHAADVLHTDPALGSAIDPVGRLLTSVRLGSRCGCTAPRHPARARWRLPDGRRRHPGARSRRRSVGRGRGVSARPRRGQAARHPSREGPALQSRAAPRKRLHRSRRRGPRVRL